MCAPVFFLLHSWEMCRKNSFHISFSCGNAYSTRKKFWDKKNIAEHCTQSSTQLYSPPKKYVHIVNISQLSSQVRNWWSGICWRKKSEIIFVHVLYYFFTVEQSRRRSRHRVVTSFDIYMKLFQLLSFDLHTQHLPPLSPFLLSCFLFYFRPALFFDGHKSKWRK